MKLSLSVRIAESPKRKDVAAVPVEDLAPMARRAGFQGLSMRASVVSIDSPPARVAAVRPRPLAPPRPAGAHQPPPRPPPPGRAPPRPSPLPSRPRPLCAPSAPIPLSPSCRPRRRARRATAGAHAANDRGQIRASGMGVLNRRRGHRGKATAPGTHRIRYIEQARGHGSGLGG